MQLGEQVAARLHQATDYQRVLHREAVGRVRKAALPWGGVQRALIPNPNLDPNPNPNSNATPNPNPDPDPNPSPNPTPYGIPDAHDRQPWP